MLVSGRVGKKKTHRVPTFRWLVSYLPKKTNSEIASLSLKAMLGLEDDPFLLKWSLFQGRHVRRVGKPFQVSNHLSNQITHLAISTFPTAQVMRKSLRSSVILGTPKERSLEPGTWRQPSMVGLLVPLRSVGSVAFFTTQKARPISGI